MRNLIILVLALSVLFGCTESTTSGKNIDEMTKILTSKKWRFDIPLIKEKFEGIKSKMNPAQQEVVRNIFPRLQFASFEFSTDNRIKLDFNNGNSISDGTWVFTNDGSALVLTFSSVKEIPHLIMEFGEDKIYLQENIDAGLLYPKIFVPLAEGTGIKQTTSPTPTEEKGGEKLDLNKK